MAERGRTIVVADDDQDILMLVMKRLTKRGWDVVVARDGAEALSTIRSVLPAAAVLDWMMPNMSGPEVCAALKADPATAAIPAVLVTARASGGDRDEGFAAGADDYVVKPFEIEVLDSALRRLTGVSPAAR
jgi:DNA-binding response OmpR family regulator